MAAREEDTFVDEINSIVPILNGNKYPEIPKKSDYGPSQPAKSKHYGPKVMAKRRDLILLSIGKRISFFKADAEEIEGLVYFSTYSIEKIANYHRFNRPIDYQRYHAKDRYMKYKDEGLIAKQVSKKPRGSYVFVPY